MKKPFQHLMIGSILLSLWACMEIKPITPNELLTVNSNRPSNNNSCQPLPIEQNIIGTWHFESNRSPVGTLRRGIVTFDTKGNLIDPDSLFSNYVNVGDSSPMAKVVNKRYDSDGKYPFSFSDYKGKVFQVDLLIKGNRMGEIWPLYVAANDCNKIVINQVSTYTTPIKLGFTLTRQ